MWWSICITVRRLHVVVASMGHKRWSIDMHYCWSASRCCSKHGAQDNNDGRYACSSASRCCRANPNGSANPTIRQSRWSAMRQSRWSGRSRTTSTRSANPTSRQSRCNGRTNSILSLNALDPLEPLERFQSPCLSSAPRPHGFFLGLCGVTDLAARCRTVPGRVCWAE